MPSTLFFAQLSAHGEANILWTRTSERGRDNRLGGITIWHLSNKHCTPFTVTDGRWWLVRIVASSLPRAALVPLRRMIALIILPRCCSGHGEGSINHGGKNLQTNIRRQRVLNLGVLFIALVTSVKNVFLTDHLQWIEVPSWLSTEGHSQPTLQLTSRD